MKSASIRVLLAAAGGAAALIVALVPPLVLEINELWFVTPVLAALLFLGALFRRKWLVMLSASLVLAGVCVTAVFFPMHLSTVQREKLTAAGQVLKARTYFSLNIFDSAAAAFTHPSLSNQKSAWLDYQIAKTYAMRGDVEESFFIFARLSKVPEAYEFGQPDLDYAYAAFELHSFEPALEAFDDAIRANRAPGYSYFQKALIYQEMGKLDSAKEMLTRAHRLYCDRSTLSMMLGRILESEKDLEGAEELYLRALKENPENLAVHAYYANLLFTLGRAEESRRMLEKGLGMMRWVGKYANPSDAAILLNGVGLVYSRAGNLGYGEMFFIQSIEMNPAFMDPYLNLAQLYYRQDHLYEAQTILGVVLSYNPQYTPARQMLEAINASSRDTLN